MALHLKKVRELRDENNLYQKEVAEQVLGIAQPHYARYETGVRDFPIEHIISLAELYNVSTDYLLGLTEDKTPYKRIKKAKENKPTVKEILKKRNKKQG